MKLYSGVFTNGSFETTQSLAGMQIIIKNYDGNVDPAINVTTAKVLDDVEIEVIMQYDGGQETIIPKRSLEMVSSVSAWGRDSIHDIVLSTSKGYVVQSIEWSGGEHGESVAMRSDSRYIVNVYSKAEYEFEFRGIKNVSRTKAFQTLATLGVDSNETKEQFVETERGNILALVAPIHYHNDNMDFKIIATYPNGDDVELGMWELISLSLRTDEVHSRKISASKVVGEETANKFVVLPMFSELTNVVKFKIVNNTNDRIDFTTVMLKSL